jgi:alcohol dehydrogenase (NADP+)
MVALPSLGFGSAPPAGGRGEDLRPALGAALAAGARLFDSAEVYGTEPLLGELLAGLPATARRGVVVGTKVWRTNHAPEHAAAACRRSRERLGVDRLGYYLIHHPEPWRHRGPLEIAPGWDRGSVEAAAVPRGGDGAPEPGDVPLRETWEALLDLRSRGWVERVGLCNVTPDDLGSLAGAGLAPPDLVQVELHPLLPRRELRRHCREQGVALMAHTPLGAGRVLHRPEVAALARALGRSPAQVVLGWHLAHGVVPVVGTRHPDHARADLAARDRPLPAAAVRALDALGDGAETA